MTGLDGPALSATEAQILRSLGAGEPGSAVAVHMDMDLSDVAAALRRIRHRLGVRSTAAAIAEAQRLGLLAPAGG